MKELSQLISDIQKMKENNAFRKYIDYIQFPYFRNLEKDTRITFEFPLTVFVGQNGSGKSSTLHALYGSPHKKTPYDYWFSTAVDPIVEVSEGGDRHCFFYVYKNGAGEELEVLKLRIFKRNNPDYWETSRPVISYGMKKLDEGKRNKPIEKEVVYIDFRSELSAFDKYFYFKTPKQTKTIKNKQDFLRKYSFFLKKLIDETTPNIIRYKKKQNEPLKNLSNQELKQVSFILGKKYTSGKIVRHKLFEEWGYSVLFQTNDYSYSEAFAGSGEMAVVRLVLEVIGAPQYALVLLDEPEVSLHPGAQKRLKQFILDQIKIKKLQVVISSHSPSLIEDLPSEAIKVFSHLPNGKFFVKNGITPAEAFYHLEQTNPAKKALIVEDDLAKKIIDSVLESIGQDTASLFEITFYTGGASVLKNNFITIFSIDNSWNKHIIFDGDQNPGSPHFNSDQILTVEQTNERLKTEIKNQTGCDVPFYPDGNQNQGAREDQEKGLRLKYLKFYLNNVHYLPLKNPEDIIWDQEVAEKLLRTLEKADSIESLADTDNTKEKFRRMSVVMTGDNSGIEFLEKMFLKNWLQKKDAHYYSIVEVINRIKINNG